MSGKLPCIRKGCSYGEGNGYNCDLWSECALFLAGTEKPKQNKYHNEKVEWRGQVYDSRKEFRRHLELLMLERSGKIKNLQRQVKYLLIPAQYEPDIIGKRGGVKRGKCIEREVAYWADFVYEDENGETVVEDTKSGNFRTTEYVIKRKLLLWRYGIRIKEL